MDNQRIRAPPPVLPLSPTSQRTTPPLRRAPPTAPAPPTAVLRARCSPPPNKQAWERMAKRSGDGRGATKSSASSISLSHRVPLAARPPVTTIGATDRGPRARCSPPPRLFAFSPPSPRNLSSSWRGEGRGEGLPLLLPLFHLLLLPLSSSVNQALPVHHANSQASDKEQEAKKPLTRRRWRVATLSPLTRCEGAEAPHTLPTPPPDLST